MPLDAATLDAARWLVSYRQRRGDNDDEEGQGLLQRLHDADQTRRVAMFEHQTARREQRASDNHKKKLDRHAFQILLAACHDAETAAHQEWKRMLYRLPNYVDTEIIASYPPWLDEASSFQKKKKKPKAVDHNLPYQLGLYHRVTFTTTAWSARGYELCQALSQYLMAHATATSTSQYATVWTLPSVLPLPDEPHGACLYGDRLADSSHTVLVSPSWMTLVSSKDILAGKSFLDRQLPRHYLLTGPVVGPDGAVPTESNPWRDHLATDTYLHVLVVTGPSLTADSRPMQLDLLQQWQTTLAALLPTTTTSNHYGWHTVGVPPAQLEPYESSRMVLQVTDDKTKSTTTLVSVSNLESYASLGVRHGTTKEPLHMVLVQVAPVSVLVHVMVEFGGGASAATTNDDTTFTVPSCLSVADRVWHVQRKVVVGKGGKRTVQSISQPLSSPDEKPSSLVLSKQQIQQSIMNAGMVKPTKEQILGEALTCPFGFLPFYEK